MLGKDEPMEQQYEDIRISPEFMDATGPLVNTQRSYTVLFECIFDDCKEHQRKKRKTQCRSRTDYVMNLPRQRKWCFLHRYQWLWCAPDVGLVFGSCYRNHRRFPLIGCLQKEQGLEDGNILDHTNSRWGLVHTYSVVSNLPMWLRDRFASHDFRRWGRRVGSINDETLDAVYIDRYSWKKFSWRSKLALELHTDILDTFSRPCGVAMPSYTSNESC